MNNENPAVGGISPRRLAALVGAAVLIALAVVAVAFYRQLGTLLQPYQYQAAAVEGVETQDVRVQLGPIRKVLNLAGRIDPSRQAELALRTAQGEVKDVPVAVGQSVQAGQPLLQLDEAALQRQLAEARGDLLEARSELSKLTQESTLSKRIKLQDELGTARTALDDATRALRALQAGKGSAQEKRALAAAHLSNVRIDLEALQNSKERKQLLDQLQVAYNEAEVKHGPYVLIAHPSEQDLDMELMLRHDMLNKQEALEQAKLQYAMDLSEAEHQVTLAERTLRDLDRQIAAGSAEIELIKAEAAVAQADAKVQQIEAQLQALLTGAPDADVARARAEVVKLEGTVADAEAALAESTLSAPFDGVIDQVNAYPGMVVSPGTVLVTMFDASTFHALARAMDVDVAQLEAGMEVQLTFDAFPGETLSGTLGQIPAFGTYENGLTLFDVVATFDPGQLPLHLGMTTNILVPLFRKDDALIVPAMAVQRDEEGPFVIVVQGRRTERRRVELGISDGINIEITRGLEKGEVVRVALQGQVRGW